MKIPFIGQTYENRIVPVSNQRCINFYPETEPGDARNVVTLQSVSGTQSFATIVDSPYDSIRAMHFNEKNQKLYVVDNTDVYEVDQTGNVSSSLGTIGGGTISMTDNGDDIVITTGTTYYYYDISAGTLGTVANGANADDCTFQDGYILFTEAGTDRWRWSNLNDAQTITATDFASSNASVDLVVGIAQVERRVWIFGTDSITIWYNSGGASIPWSLVEGGSSNGYGLASKKGKVVLDSRVYWVSNDGKIYASNGYQPQPISHYGIENSMRQYGNISDCHASAWSENGHKFIAFTFPSGDETWVYDVTTGMWHQRSTYIESNTAPGKWSGIDVTRAWRKNIVGDSTYGRIGRLEVDLYTEYGGEMVSRRSSPSIHDSQNVVTHDRLELLFNAGDTQYVGTQTFIKEGNEKTLGAASNNINEVTGLESNLVAIHNPTDGLITYSFDGLDWTQVGNALSISGVGVVGLDAMTSTRVAFVDSLNDDLRSYDWDGTDWTQHSDDLNLGGSFGNGNLCALSTTEVAVVSGVQTTNDWLRKYTLSGTTWSLTGNSLDLGVDTQAVRVTSLTKDRVVVMFTGDDSIQAYDFDGTDWATVGNSYAVNVTGGGDGLAALDSETIVIANSTSGNLETYTFDGTDWTLYGSPIDIADISGNTVDQTEVALLEPNRIAITQGGTSFLQAYQRDAGANSPTVQLRWSDDGGNVWSQWVDRPIGATGEYRNRAVWYRLGQTQNRVYEMRVSDDTSRSLIDAVLEGAGGSV